MSKVQLINDGGPAFPQMANTGMLRALPDGYVEADKEMRGGLSIRDYFAGQALAGLIAADGQDSESGDAQFYYHGNPSAAAFMAYKLADAMLAARERKEDA